MFPPDEIQLLDARMEITVSDFVVYVVDEMIPNVSNNINSEMSVVLIKVIHEFLLSSVFFFLAFVGI